MNKLIKSAFILILSIPIQVSAGELSLDTYHKVSDSNINLGLGGNYKTEGFTFSGMGYSESKLDKESIKSNVFSVKRIKLGIKKEVEILPDLYVSNALESYIDTRNGQRKYRIQARVVFYF